MILSAAAKTAIVFVLSSLYLKDAEFTFYIVSFILIIEVVTLFFQYSNFKKQQKQTAQLQRELENNKISWESQRDKEDFLAMWAHQIKTPIAALKLLLQSDKQDVTACKGEVFKIEHYVEMALGFLRFEEMGNDLELLSYELEPIVKQSIKKFAPMFISKHLSVNLKDLNVKMAFVRDRAVAFKCGKVHIFRRYNYQNLYRKRTALHNYRGHGNRYTQ